MTSKNDVTGDSLITKASTDNYRSNYDAIFKKPVVQEARPAYVVSVETPPQDVCFECHKQSHSMGCGSKSVYDAYITLRDSGKWKYFTDIMLTELDNKVRLEISERKYSDMFDGMSEEEGND